MPNLPNEFLSISLGCIVLLAGRNVFWLVVGLIGFLLGIEIGRVWLADQPMWIVAMGAVALGMVGVVVAIFFERVAFMLAGFFAASFLVALIPVHLGFASPPPLVALTTGIFGAIIAALVMDRAIIVLSALAGAAVIVSALPLAPLIQICTFAALVLLGIVVQNAILQRRKPRR